MLDDWRSAIACSSGLMPEMSLEGWALAGEADSASTSEASPVAAIVKRCPGRIGSASLVVCRVGGTYSVAPATSARRCARGRSYMCRAAPASARGSDLHGQLLVQLRQLPRVDRVGVLGARVAARAHVLGERRDAGVHLLLEVGVALDEAGSEAVADAEEVVEDEHLPIGGGAGP